MASNGEYKRYEQQTTKESANHHHHHHQQSVKHRVGNAARPQQLQQPSRMASNRVSSSRQSSSSGDHGRVVKSRIGTAAAIKALCGKAAAAAEKNKLKKSPASGSSGKGGDDGSIVKAPGKAGIGGQVHCETSSLTEKERNAPQSIATGDEKCHDVPYRHIPEKCVRPKDKWQNGIYCRDECGSGIIAKKFEFKHSRQLWCSTPLSMYQATIGELGRQILCREKIVPRDVKPEPPCNIAEYILPPCRGYYRKYDCIRPCEEEYVSYKQGRKLYRDRVERYWEPCTTKEQRAPVDINTFAGQNVFLGAKLRRRFNESIPCW